MNDTQHPELHVNEEPRNDFIDVGVGFMAAFGVFFLIAVIFTIIAVVTGHPEQFAPPSA